MCPCALFAGVVNGPFGSHFPPPLSPDYDKRIIIKSNRCDINFIFGPVPANQECLAFHFSFILHSAGFYSLDGVHVYFIRWLIKGKTQEFSEAIYL